MGSVVLLDDGWLKSSFSQGGNCCVEIRPDERSIKIRDSKNRRDPSPSWNEEPIVSASLESWRTLIGQIQMHRPLTDGEIAVVDENDGGASMIEASSGVTLTFTPEEWRAFILGARDDQFNF